jgi:hypothetical protein
MAATRQRWSEKEELATRFQNFSSSSRGCEIPPEKTEPGHSEASLATVTGDGIGDA